MPRTKLDQFSQKPETYRKAVKKCIQAAMIREDVPMYKSLAVDMDMNPRQLRDRINKTGFRDYELVKLDRILKFTDKERDDMGTIITIIGTATVAGWFMKILSRLEGER